MCNPSCAYFSTCSPSAISDNAEIRQYILDLKAEFTKSQTINLHQISVSQTIVDSEANDNNQTTCTFIPNQDAIMEDVGETSETEPRKRNRRWVMRV